MGSNYLSVTRVFGVKFALVIYTALFACVPEEESADVKQHSMQKMQTKNLFFRWWVSRKLLIKLVHEDDWNIEITYDDGVNFTDGEKEKLEEETREIIDMWLEQVRNLNDDPKDRPVIKKENILFGQEGSVDLKIVFKDEYGRSNWRADFNGIGVVTMFKAQDKDNLPSGDNRIPSNTTEDVYPLNVYAHEFGHAFGLGDITQEYALISIMKGPLSNNMRQSLTPDDITGISHLYGHYVTKEYNEKTCPSEEHVWDEKYRSCAPKFPLIYLAKYSKDSSLILKMLLTDESTNVNQRDDEGKTALHHAISQRNFGIVNELIRNRTGGGLVKGSDPIKINLPDQEGRTPFHTCAIQGENGETKLILDKLLEHNINASAKDNAGNTAYNLADLRNTELANNNRITGKDTEVSPWSDLDKFK